jgi:predicted SnoaL-like aldol condensation-catalyzing enzyme
MTNKEIVLKAMKEFFVERDINAIERYWHESYVQHNPSMINGHQGLRDILEFLGNGKMLFHKQDGRSKLTLLKSKVYETV